MLEPSPNATDHWTVETQLVSQGGGLADVAVTVTNEALGRFPPFHLKTDWKPGMEAADVESHAAALAAQSLRHLSEALIAHAVKLMLPKSTLE